MRRRHERLIPCPCCGSRAAIIRHEIYSAMGMRVICTGCRLATRLVPYGVGFARFERGQLVDYTREVTPQQAADEAAALWNTRQQNAAKT